MNYWVVLIIAAGTLLRLARITCPLLGNFATYQQAIDACRQDILFTVKKTFPEHDFGSLVED